MRKFIVTIIAAAAIMLLGAQAASADGLMLEYDGGTHEYNGEVYALVVNNQLLDPPLSPIIFNDRALVPVREIFEEVGAEVNYIGATQTVEVIGDDTYISLTINDNVAVVNGNKTKIPDNVVPKIISKVGGEPKTMVPVRFISESIGLDVQFDADDGAILIDSDDYSFISYEPAEYSGYSYAEEEEFEIAMPEEIPVPTIRVTDVSYDIKSNTEATVTITTEGEIESYADFVLKSPERIVLDIPNARLANVSENTEVNAGGISMIRLGANTERARIVLDMDGLKKYSVAMPESNVLEISTTINRKSSQSTERIEESTPQPEVRQYTPQPSSEKLIVLDAGHGGSDSGAVGYLDGVQILEKDLTLQITYRIKDILESAGYTVSMTRTGDTLPSLSERPAQANEENAALFVSVHINAADTAPEAHGTEVFYATENNDDGYGTDSQTLAKNVLERMLYYMKSVNRGVKTAEHAVTRRCKMPAVLAEVGFITNDEEVRLMTDDSYQQKAAQGIAEGIMITLRDIVVPE